MMNLLFIRLKIHCLFSKSLNLTINIRWEYGIVSVGILNFT